MYARIIPSIRTPRRVTAFDYAVPDGMRLERGDLVRIPFRASELIGLVSEVVDQPSDVESKLKPVIGRYADLRFRTETVTLLDRLARRSFSSPGTVLRAWIDTCPRRAVAEPARVLSRTGRRRETRVLRNHVDAPGGIIETANSLIEAGTKTLLLAPWAARAERIALTLKARLLTSAMPMGARYASWSSFVRGNSPCLVATRVGAWLAGEADVILIDEPENDDHKQDELAPRYDARWLAEAAHELGSSLVEIGLTPRLGDTRSPDEPVPALAPDLIAVDVSGKDWSPVAGLQHRTLNAIDDAIADGRPVTIIHPIHGERARVRCADCSWEPTCPSCGGGLRPEADGIVCARCGKPSPNAHVCAVCGSMNLSKSRPGREKLERELRARINAANVRVFSIGEWNASDLLPSGSLLVCTDLALLSGLVEDIRRKERLILAFRRLADRAEASGSTLCVQADYRLLAEAKTWLTDEGLRAAYERERSERAAFHLPPARRLVKLIFRGAVDPANAWRERLANDPQKPPDFAYSSLYPVQRRYREPRWICHLTTPRETPDEAMYRHLEPLGETDTLVDLDPIAFFE